MWCGFEEEAYQTACVGIGVLAETLVCELFSLGRREVKAAAAEQQLAASKVREGGLAFVRRWERSEAFRGE